jgi:hypothetical protein
MSTPASKNREEYTLSTAGIHITIAMILEPDTTPGVESHNTVRNIDWVISEAITWIYVMRRRPSRESPNAILKKDEIIQNVLLPTRYGIASAVALVAVITDIYVMPHDKLTADWAMVTIPTGVLALSHTASLRSRDLRNVRSFLWATWALYFRMTPADIPHATCGHLAKKIPHATCGKRSFSAHFLRIPTRAYLRATAGGLHILGVRLRSYR